MDKESALMELKRIFISPMISTERMAKVKAMYREIKDSPTFTVDMQKKVARIQSGKF